MAKRRATSVEREAQPPPPLTPLAYLLSVVADEQALMRDRLAAARAVLPYLCLPLRPLERDEDDSPLLR
jgi:hypothetical protein